MFIKGVFWIHKSKKDRQHNDQKKKKGKFRYFNFHFNCIYDCLFIVWYICLFVCLYLLYDTYVCLCVCIYCMIHMFVCVFVCVFVCMFVWWCLSQLLAIFKLYRGGQFYCWRTPEDPEKTIDKSLTNFIT
jgi:hypothetical protein